MKNENFELKIELKKYITGYFLSIVLTVLAILTAVVMNVTKASGLLLLSLFGVAQLLVQLIYFMHIKEENKPRYILMNLIFFILVVLIISLGIIFIMYQLHYTH